ncbi:flagellar biosynthesis protein FlgN [Roseobacter ponti]|uniref:Flagellar protein FlgN n=1 Tax=Roseobacter ponti TaxID=1891787 RepID=A0A858SYP3_9RHOB|nr:flagellar biosynthesis protein FlgN [Roseobacter ponti]QJF52992.1 flagellar protein FlgN [Roseobacter ponti]
MADDEFHRIFDALDDLLDEERTALLEGNLDHVARLLETKETLIDALADLDANEVKPLQELDKKVRRNQVLLDSALAGIRSVAERLTALRRVRRSLDTYDAKGVRQTIDMVSDKSVEKRA